MVLAVHGVGMRSEQDLERKREAISNFQQMLDEDDELHDLLGGIEMGIVYALSEGGDDDLPV